MNESKQIDELMHRWEEARKNGVLLTAEDLCGDCPELTEKIRERLQAIATMELVLGVEQAETLHDPQTPHEDLPSVPGYEIIRVIDRGGMGVVFEARQIGLDRIVALKMLPGMAASPKAVARFCSEAELAARLHHPNIVQIFEVGKIGAQPFFSMELVRGGNLAQLLESRELTVQESASMIETVAKAVHLAHQAGVIHRDLKPANVLMTEDGVPRIADFGLAKRLDTEDGHTHTGEILGTPSYMAPEQAEGRNKDIGPLTDVYALGAILYEMITGRPPFKGATVIEALKLIASQEPTPPSHVTKKVPRDLEAICLKCLEKDSKDRYDSASDLADDLRRYLNGEPIQARHVSRLRRGWKWIKRHPLKAGAILFVVLLMLSPLAFLYLQYRERQQIRERAEALAPQAHEILKRNCWECHGQNPKQIDRNLDILNHEQLIDEKRPLIIPGKPSDSRLFQRIRDGSMPPRSRERELPLLTENEINILSDWIRGGAPTIPIETIDSVPRVEPFSEFAMQAKRVFLKNCYRCHSQRRNEGGIAILHHRLLLSIRKVVVPGDAENSELYQLLILKGDMRMPPADSPPLTAEEIATVKRWIDEGAPAFPKGE